MQGKVICINYICRLYNYKTKNKFPMKFLSICILFALFSSCSHKTDKPIVEAAFMDSVMHVYDSSNKIKNNNADLLFWLNKINTSESGFINELQYAGNLSQRYLLSGHISDLVTADSIVNKKVQETSSQNAGILRSMAHFKILQHQFLLADSLIQKAINIGSDKYSSLLMKYDTEFELGYYAKAEQSLKALESTNDYGYFFRKARQFHYQGEHDSSIAAMNKAVQWAEGYPSLLQITYSNMGDLQLHKGNIEEAYSNYKKSLQIDPADLHSIMNIGWIASKHDNKDSLALSIFKFIKQKTVLPDVLLKEAFVYEKIGDSAMAKQVAAQFAGEVSKPVYGNMYNKYLIDLYTGLLINPPMAKEIAIRELTIRKTPAAYSWYAYTLFKNGENAEAEKVYKNYVSGKPLEGLELYYMGMMQEGVGKNYNAKKYLEAAFKNRYDLDAVKIKNIEAALN